MSIGIALLEAGEDSFTLLQRADRAMLGAKQQGGNRCLLAVSADPDNPLDARRARSYSPVIRSRPESFIKVPRGGLLFCGAAVWRLGYLIFGVD